MSSLRIVAAVFDDPAVQALHARLQQVYRDRYGVADAAPLDPVDFVPPCGGSFLACSEERPVGTGAWRRSTHSAFGANVTAEIKRIYVVEEAQHSGIARRMLAHIEADIAVAGIEVAILHTGPRQPEAFALYSAAGYTRVLPFGPYGGRGLERLLGERIGARAGRRLGHFLGKRLIATSP